MAKSPASKESSSEKKPPARKPAGGAKAAIEKLPLLHEHDASHAYCGLKPQPERVFEAGVTAPRLEAIIVSDKKWVNGTRLHYYFFDKPTDGEQVLFNDGTRRFIPWAGAPAQKDVVRRAFKTWKDIGIGLEFEEVADRNDAEIRIGFMQGDGAWSYLGRDILNFGPDHRTMNFGWSLTGPDGFDTALHEIGHTLGLPHEHQNPNAGIVWNEEEVYRRLALPPNNWPRATTFSNIIQKINPATVRGTDWDRDSIMHYPFEAGMISVPEEFRTRALRPAGGLSARDKAWVKETYPPQNEKKFPELKVFVAQKLDLKAGEQFDGIFKPDQSRRYTIATFGPTDMVMVLFEQTPEGPVFLDGDDDSGVDLNAKITHRLLKGRSYIIRARLFYNWAGGGSALMVY